MLSSNGTEIQTIEFTGENSNDLLIKPLIVINSSMNAFVTGNNFIYIHTGLLENLDSFEELEGVVDKYYDKIERAKSKQPTPDW